MRLVCSCVSAPTNPHEIILKAGAKYWAALFLVILLFFLSSSPLKSSFSQDSSITAQARCIPQIQDTEKNNPSTLETGAWLRWQHSPVISVTGISGEWDAAGMAAKSCVRNGDLFHLFYQGDSGTGGSGSLLIGKATSIDLVNWTKCEKPLFSVGTPGSWDSYFVGMPSVIMVDSIWYLFYEGNDGNHSNIGLALSTDGLDFRRIKNGIDGTAVVLPIGPPGSWDDNNLGTPTIVRTRPGDPYRFALYYTAQDAATLTVRTGVAFSNDLISWVKEKDNPILDNGEPGEWDGGDVTASDVLIDADGHYTMLYCATGKYWGIGIARSSDGVYWEKHPQNPVLIGSGTGFDAENVQLPLCPVTGRILYSGAGSLYQIGLCSINPDDVIAKNRDLPTYTELNR